MLSLLVEDTYGLWEISGFTHQDMETAGDVLGSLMSKGYASLYVREKDGTDEVPLDESEVSAPDLANPEVWKAPDGSYQARYVYLAAATDTGDDVYRHGDRPAGAVSR
jgi:hypothetical protein